MIRAFEDGTVIGLPDDLPPAAVPLRVEVGDDGVIIELPTDVDGRRAARRRRASSTCSTARRYDRRLAVGSELGGS